MKKNYSKPSMQNVAIHSEGMLASSATPQLRYTNQEADTNSEVLTQERSFNDGGFWE